MPGTSSFDIAVIGGGLVGSAVAFGLVKQGATVAVIDEGDVAFRASRGNFGLIWVQGKGASMPSYARWTQFSSDLWPEFNLELSEEAGLDLHYARPGGFHFCLSQSELEARAAMLAKLSKTKGLDLSYEIVDGATLRKQFPRLGPDIAGGSYSRRDGHVNPLRLLRALRKAFLNRGGCYFPGGAVQSIVPQSADFATITSERTVRSSKVILAAGLGNRILAPMVGLDAPVTPERGQILVTSRMPRFLDGPTTMMRQTAEGSLMLGDSMEDAGFDDRTTPNVMKMLANRAVTTFPALREAKVVRAWGALRIMTPDGCPVYDHSRKHPGAFVISLHSGVTLAAAHAERLAPAMLSGNFANDLSTFGIERFNVPKAA